MLGPRCLFHCIALLLIPAIAVAASAQQVAPLSKHDSAIKRKADALARGTSISVIPTQGDEQFGTFFSNDSQGFTFHDVDRNIDVTLRYADVRKLKQGYGGYNSVRGRHTDRTRGLIVTVVVLGGLGALIAAAATAKN